ncbi:MAG: prefoldin subunit [Nanoarchaeota archaeon]
MTEQEDKLQQLQAMEQNVTNLLMQKQQIQGKLTETDSALKEMKGKQQVYRIIGNIMVLSDTAAVQKELDENRNLLQIRLKSIEKQEEKFRERAKKLQDDILSSMKK